MTAPEILTPTGGEGDIRLAARIARRLDRGAVAALPTETLYGLCCRAAEAAARARIFALKGRPEEKALPYLLADPEDITLFVNRVPAAARKLARRFWPGPLTLVLGDDPGIALRVPDQAFTREVLRRAGGPVQGTSANRSGSPAATTAAEVLAAFPEGLDLIVDGGAAPLARPSTIVRVPPRGGLQVLRPGALDEDSLRAAAAASILFVCTGNTCRSPMAAAVTRQMLSEALGTKDPERAGYRVSSAGLASCPGGPLSPEAGEALKRAGFPVSAHVTRALDAALIHEADLIVALGSGHLQALRADWPDAARRVRLLDPVRDVPDPFGGTAEVYDGCLAQIRASVATLLPEILGLGPGPTRPAAPGR